MANASTATTKRWAWAGLFALLLVAGLALVACGGNANSSDDKADESSSASSSEPVQLQIFAANSLEKALDAVQELYTKDHPDVTFADTQYLSSGDLVTNLKGGAPADILITASSSSMDDAVANGDIDEATRFNMFTNELILVTGKDSAIESATLEDLASGTHSLAIGGEGVPAGNYARQALTTTSPQCWISNDGAVGAKASGAADSGHFGEPLAGDLNGLPKVVEGSSVGNTAKYVSDGQYELGLVYSSDLYRYDGLKQVGVTPADSHKNIIYPAAVCSKAAQPEAAKAFLDWASTDEDALKLWQQYGFELATS